MDRERTQRLIVVREGESLPTAAIEFFLVRAIVQVAATRDEEYICLRNAAGTYSWASTTSIADVVTDQHAGDHTDSTASTTVYTAYLTRAVTLPAGTWTVQANGWISLVHSASLKSTIRVQVDGTGGTARVTQNLSSTAYSMWTAVAGKTGVAGGGSINVMLDFHSSGVGTTTAANGSLWITAVRTAT